MARPLRTCLLLGSILTSLVGTAQFGAEQVIGATSGPVRLQAADVDGDGDMDLFGLVGQNELQWFANTDGSGTFSAPTTIGTVDGECRQNLLADVDGDHDLDIVLLANADAAIEFWLNDGTGNFAPGTAQALPSTPETITVADLNGDGLPDLVATINSANGPGIAVLRGTPTGFEAADVFEGLHTGAVSAWVGVGDMDLIGGLDLILRGEGDALILVRNVLGDAQSWEPMELPIPEGPLGYPYHFPQVIDVDGDGDLDLAESRSPAVHWLRNDLNEGGELSFEEHVVEAWSTSGHGMFAASPCGTGAAVVFVPANPALPVRWNSFVPLLNDLPYSNDLPGLPRGTDLLFADVTGDGLGDVVMNVTGGLSLFRSAIEPPTTLLELPAIDTLCLGGPAVALPEAIPAGGHWYGLQIQNDLLFRANLGSTMDVPTVHAVYAANGCPMAAEGSIHVMQEPTITTLIPPVVCSADAPFALVASPTVVEWFGLNGSNVVDPANWNGGYIVCQYTDATGSTCANVEGPIQRWNSLPASLAPAGPFCVNDTIQTISAAAAPPFNVNWSGPVSDTTPGSAQFDPALGAGTYEIVLTAEPFGPNQCRNSDTLLVVVGDLPQITFEPMAVHCANGAAIALDGAQPEGGIWSGNAVAEGQIDPLAAGAGIHLITYRATTVLGCAAQASTTIELAEAATVEWSAPDLFFCAGDDDGVFTGFPAGGTWGAPLTAEGVLHIGSLSPGVVPIHYTYTDPQGCTLTNAEIHAELGAPAEVSISVPAHICADHEAFALHGSMAGTWSGAVNGEGSSVLFDPGVLGAGTWHVVLAVVPGAGCPGSASADLEVSICAGVEDAAMVEPRIAPNPFAERTLLILGQSGMAQVQVIDATGRVVVTRQAMGAPGAGIELDLSGQAPGMYTVHVAYADAVSSIRVVKAE